MDKRLELFRQDPGFEKLFVRFREKFRSVGRIGGTVKVADFSRGELESVAGFLALSPETLKMKGTVSLKIFEEQLARTNLEGMSLKQVLECYFDEPLISKADEKAKREQDDKVFYEQLIGEYPHLAWWFTRILQKKPDTRFMYSQDKGELASLLRTVARAYEMLPKAGKYERLPLFSQRITGNPHSFDRNQLLGKMLLHLLAWGQGDIGADGLPGSQTEQINELLLGYGLLRDDLWSFVTCRGFRAIQNQEEHPVWLAAAQCGTVMNIPVRELMQLERIMPFEGKNVWVLENSGVCSALLDEVPDKPLVCTHGQFKVASWIFFDRLVESGYTIYYSGDLDPEGLMMAQRLKSRYPENVEIWRMDPKSYKLALSDEKIEDRIAQLNNIVDPELKETADTMIKHGRAAYQEGLLQILIEDLKKVVGV